MQKQECLVEEVEKCNIVLFQLSLLVLKKTLSQKSPQLTTSHILLARIVTSSLHNPIISKGRSLQYYA